MAGKCKTSQLWLQSWHRPEQCQRISRNRSNLVSHKAWRGSVYWGMCTGGNKLLLFSTNIPWLLSVSNAVPSSEGMLWQHPNFDHNLTRHSAYRHKAMLMVEFNRPFTIGWRFFFSAMQSFVPCVFFLMIVHFTFLWYYLYSPFLVHFTAFTSNEPVNTVHFDFQNTCSPSVSKETAYTENSLRV